MIIPESIYSGFMRTPILPPRRQFLYKALVNSAAATITTVLTTVDRGYDLILQSLIIQAIGGGAQTVARHKCRVLSLETVGESVWYDLFHKLVSGSVEDVYEWQGSLYIPSQSYIQVLNDFSAGAIGNSHYIYATGFLIPQAELMK